MNSPFVRGLPVVAFVVGGAYGLSFYVESKQDAEARSMGLKSSTKRDFDLEEDYKKTMKAFDADVQLVQIKRPKPSDP